MATYGSTDQRISIKPAQSDHQRSGQHLLFSPRLWKWYFWAALAVIFVLAALGITVGISFALRSVSSQPSADGSGFDPSTLETFSQAAVSTDGKECAPIGMKVLKRNGSAVDAAIATLFCNGLYSSQSMGIGGGFVMVVYQKSTGKADTLIARETAPAAASVNMFKSDASLSSNGGLAVAVPGEVRGYYEAKKKYGNPDVSWKSLIGPSIRMARRDGIPVSQSLASALQKEKEAVFRDDGMRSVFVNPDTNDTWKQGDKYFNYKLADTLERIANFGPDDFYLNQTAHLLVQDLKQSGGIITLEDLRNYRAVWSDPVVADLGEDLVYGVTLPASGAIVVYMLNILKHFKLTADQRSSPVTYQRMVEAFKWAYAERSKLGDPADATFAAVINQVLRNLTSEDYARSTFAMISDSLTYNSSAHYGGQFLPVLDSGTSHTSVLAQNGDAVSVTSTINQHFGSGFLSKQTGIILNDEMDDFSSPNIVNEYNLPPSPHNLIAPGKRPMSSMSPVIVIHRKTGRVRLVTGAAGGSRISTSVAQVVMRYLWLGQNLKESLDERRLHHQLMPMLLDYEDGFDPAILEQLQAWGHKLNKISLTKSAVSGVAQDAPDGPVSATWDFRKSGGVAGF